MKQGHIEFWRTDPPVCTDITSLPHVNHNPLELAPKMPLFSQESFVYADCSR